MDTATVAITGYILLMVVALAVSSFREGFILPSAGATVVYLWVFGEIAARLFWSIPTGLYLTLDTAAAICFWVLGRTPGAKIFASTFILQVMLSLGYTMELIALSPMEYWWLHTWTGYAQLFVLIGWALVEWRKEDA